MEKRSNFSSFPQYFLPVVRFSCLGMDQIFTSRQAVIRDKRVRDSESQLYTRSMSRGTPLPTRLHRLKSKTQISLRIRAV